jgi:hypothetical protein
MDRLTLYGSFTSSSSYKPMLYLALARLPFSFRTVNLKTGVQKSPEYLAVNRWGVVPSLRHRGLTILQSNVILDYLARETGHFESRSAGRRANGCPGKPITSPMSPRCGTQRGFAPLTPRRSPSFARAPKQHGPLSTRPSRTSRSWSAIIARSPILVAGGAWFSWPKAASTSPTGPISRHGRDASKRCPGSRSPMR